MAGVRSLQWYGSVQKTIHIKHWSLSAPLSLPLSVTLCYQNQCDILSHNTNAMSHFPICIKVKQKWNCRRFQSVYQWEILISQTFLPSQSSILSITVFYLQMNSWQMSVDMDLEKHKYFSSNKRFVLVMSYNATCAHLITRIKTSTNVIKWSIALQYRFNKTKKKTIRLGAMTLLKWWNIWQT